MNATDHARATIGGTPRLPGWLRFVVGALLGFGAGLVGGFVSLHVALGVDTFNIYFALPAALVWGCFAVHAVHLDGWECVLTSISMPVVGVIIAGPLNALCFQDPELLWLTQGAFFLLVSSWYVFVLGALLVGPLIWWLMRWGSRERVRADAAPRAPTRMVVMGLCALLGLTACSHLSKANRWPTPPVGQLSMLPLMGGGELHYQTAGDGEALVLIHGGFGDQRMWDEVFFDLADDFAVVRYDHRGFGKSSVPDAVYSPVADLLRLLDHLAIERAILVGNSLGGELALDFALLHPERVSSLVVVSSGPNGLPVPEADSAPVLEVFTAARERSLDEAAELWLANPMVKVTAADPRRAPKLERMLRQNAGVFRMPFDHWPGEPLDPPTSERLGAIDVPVLLIVGSEDTPLVRWMVDYAALALPRAELVVIDGADHLPQMSHPDAFVSAVEDFLQAQQEAAEADDAAAPAP